VVRFYESILTYWQQVLHFRGLGKNSHALGQAAVAGLVHGSLDIERRYRLTRQCLEVLLGYHLVQLTVHTRSHLILDDLDLLHRFGERLRVGFSVPADDDRVRKRLEPKAPTIEVRLKTMRRLRASGIRVYAAVAPVLYCHPQRFAALLKEAADGVYCDTMAYADKTGLAFMPRAQAYFRSRAYQARVAELAACLQEVGLQAKA
jgi:DNA repair photolyase